MKKLWCALTCGVVALAFASGFSTAPAWAIKPFEVEFKKTYYKPESKDPKEKELAAAIDKITTEVEGEDGKVKNSCNICHVAKKKKEVRNEYGQKLAELLDKKADKDKPEKIQDALKKVAEMKSEKGPTYSELIKSGKLPSAE